MKLFTRPSVYLVGKQTVDEAELGRFLSENGFEWKSDGEAAGEVLCETAGRLCYLSYNNPRPGGNKVYLEHIKESGHGSVLEHAVFNLILTGISRSLSLELIRHRAGASPSQLSQRFVDESVAEVVVPPDLRGEVGAAVERFRFAWANPAFDEEECDCLLSDDPGRANPLTEQERAGVEWIRSVAVSQKTYRKTADYLAKKAAAPRVCPDCLGRGGHTTPRGEGSAWRLCETCKGDLFVPLVAGKTAQRKYARQAARSVLPNACETKIFWTVNARALRGIIEQRCSRHADPEIRHLAYELWRVCRDVAPALFGDYREEKLPDGSVELATEWRKV